MKNKTKIDRGSMRRLPTERSNAPGRSTRRSQSRRRKSKFSFDLENAVFDPNAEELNTTWSSYAPLICCINSYPNGVTLSLHTNTEKEKRSNLQGEGAFQRNGNRAGNYSKKFMPSQFHLRFKDTRDYQTPKGKYFLFKENYIRSLERQLGVLNQKGLLKDAVIYFGTTTDPFQSFHKKFDVTTVLLGIV